MQPDVKNAWDHKVCRNVSYCSHYECNYALLDHYICTEWGCVTSNSPVSPAVALPKVKEITQRYRKNFMSLSASNKCTWSATEISFYSRFWGQLLQCRVHCLCLCNFWRRPQSPSLDTPVSMLSLTTNLISYILFLLQGIYSRIKSLISPWLLIMQASVSLWSQAFDQGSQGQNIVSMHMHIVLTVP